MPLQLVEVWDGARFVFRRPPPPETLGDQPRATPPDDG